LTKPVQSIGQAYIAEARRRLAACHGKVQHCLDQLNEDQVWWRPVDSMNSIANIVLHLCGNMTQWIVSSIRRTPDTRNRPQEFAETSPIPKAELLRLLDAVVREADAALAGVTDAQLLEPRRIQGFQETVLSGTFDSIAHFNGHTQEIVYITRLQLKDSYQVAWEPETPEQGAP
jgi:hypothetical protein